MKIDDQLNAPSLTPALQKFWQLSGQKIDLIFKEYDPAKGSPVFTVAGQYTARGWTEWTEGFNYGSAFLQFDATGEQRFADSAMKRTLEQRGYTARRDEESGFHVKDPDGANVQLV